MGERLLCKQEVDGSIPFTSTTDTNGRAVRVARDSGAKRRESAKRRGSARAPRLGSTGLMIGRSWHCRLALPVWAVARPAFDL